MLELSKDRSSVKLQIEWKPLTPNKQIKTRKCTEFRRKIIWPKPVIFWSNSLQCTRHFISTPSICDFPFILSRWSDDWSFTDPTRSLETKLNSKIKFQQINHIFGNIKIDRAKQRTPLTTNRPDDVVTIVGS